MKTILILIALTLSAIFSFDPQSTTLGGKTTLGGNLAVGNAAPATPALDLYLGKTGIDTSRSATTGFNNNIFPTDQSGSPLAPTTGSLLIMDGEWPDAETTGNGYPAACTSHCAPTFTDNNSNTLTAVFTVGTCEDTGGIASGENLDHGFYYEANLPSNTSTVTENHPALVSNSVWDIGDFYNVATTSVVDASSCKTNVTPANNTAPNITGNAMTITGANDLILVAVDDVNFWPQNAFSANPLTVPAGCSLLRGNPAVASLGATRFVMQCTAGPGSFTPTFTVAQTTHDTFTIYAVAFKGGTGGTAPSTGADYHVASQVVTLGAGTYKFYPGCPAGTPAIVVTDDAGSISSLTDTNSNTYTHVITGTIGSGNGVETFYTFTPGTINPNTFQISAVSSGAGVDILTAHCLTATNLDTGYTAGTASNVSMTQVTSSSVEGTVTETTGAGNCQGTASTLITCSGLPAGTPGESGDQFIGVCEVGNGPFLQVTSPAGAISEYIGPAALANIADGDADDYLNGDFGFHYWTTAAPAAIAFAFSAQQNGSFITCMATAFHK